MYHAGSMLLNVILSILVSYIYLYTYNPTIHIVDIYNNFVESYLTYLELCYEAITYLENNQDAKSSTPKDTNKNSKYVSSPSLFTTVSICYWQQSPLIPHNHNLIIPIFHIMLISPVI